MISIQKPTRFHILFLKLLILSSLVSPVFSSSFISDIKFQKPFFVNDSFIYSTTSSSLVKFNKDLSINTVLNFQTRDFQSDIPSSKFQYKVLNLFTKSGKLHILYSNNRILARNLNSILM